jgi:hypothetical protein
VEHLIRVATAGNDDERMSRGSLSRGWVIGTAGWRKAIAREHQHLALAPEMSASEIADLSLKSLRWGDGLTPALAKFGKTPADRANTAKGARARLERASGSCHKTLHFRCPRKVHLLATKHKQLAGRSHCVRL